jgi:large subunit ribosomal protein L30
MSEKKLKVTLVKSLYGRKTGHMETVRGLGLRHRHESRVLADTPAVRGMINKVSYLIKCEGVTE